MLLENKEDAALGFLSAERARQLRSNNYCNYEPEEEVVIVIVHRERRSDNLRTLLVRSDERGRIHVCVRVCT